MLEPSGPGMGAGGGIRMGNREGMGETEGRAWERVSAWVRTWDRVDMGKGIPTLLTPRHQH